MCAKKSINYFTNQIYFLEIRNQLECSSSEVIQVTMNDFVTECVERVNVHPVCSGSDKIQQTFAHGNRTCIGVGEAKNILWLCLRQLRGEYVADSRSDDLCFACAGTSYNQHRTF